MHSGKKNHDLVDLVTTLMALYNVLLNITEARKSIVFFLLLLATLSKSQTPALCDVIGGTYLLNVRAAPPLQVALLLPPSADVEGFFLGERLQTQG